MDISKIVFVQAQDTLLYLPIKLAYEQGIFESMFNKYEESIPEIEIISKNGDEQAVEDIIESQQQGNEIKIAVADPMAIFISNNSKKYELRIVGQLITKFPFWIISGAKEKAGVFCPSKNFLTADACAGYYKSVNNVQLNSISGYNVVDKVKFEGGKGLTGEIDKMCVDGIKIEEHFATGLNRFPNDFNPLVTVLITNKSTCDKYGKRILPIVLEAIMNAIIILYSSQEMAVKSIKARMKTRKSIKIDEIARIIQNDRFYPHTLDIDESDWINTYKFYYRRTVRFYDENSFPDLQTASTDISKQDETLSKYYRIFYYNSSARIVERRLIEEFGVSCSTFDTGLDAYIKERNSERRRIWWSTYGSYVLAISLILLLFGAEVLVYKNTQLNKYDKLPMFISTISLAFGFLSFYFGGARKNIINRIKSGGYNQKRLIKRKNAKNKK